MYISTTTAVILAMKPSYLQLDVNPSWVGECHTQFTYSGGM